MVYRFWIYLVIICLKVAFFRCKSIKKRLKVEFIVALKFFNNSADQGFVDHKEAVLSIALRGNFSPATTNSAKSSGCKTES